MYHDDALGNRHSDDFEGNDAGPWEKNELGLELSRIHRTRRFSGTQGRMRGFQRAGPGCRLIRQTR